MSDTGFPILSATAQFLPGNYTVATLPTPDATYLFQYAKVTDLFGDKSDVVQCSQNGSGFCWQPVRPQYVKTINADANMTLYSLSTPNTLILTGTLSSSRTYTISPVGAWPGAEFHLVFTGSLGVNTLTVAGLDAGATISLLLNTPRHAVFDSASNTWKSLAY